MRIWSDIFSGDELCTDANKVELKFNDACLYVKAKYVTKGSDFVAIAADDEDDGGEGETVINIVDAHKLQEMEVSQKALMGMIKAYLKRLETYLKENGKEDRVPEFKKGATEMTKLIIKKFSEVQIFTGESMEENTALCFSYTEDGEVDPVFLYFMDGLKEIKV